jgi:hypothetical protein
MVTSEALALEPTDAARKLACIDGKFACQLPRVLCTVCRRRRNDPYVEYPALNTESLVPEGRGDLAPDDFKPIRERVLQRLGREVVVVPGALAGAFEGRLTGGLGDFAWLLSWTPLASRATLEVLATAGVPLRCGPARLQSKSGVVTTHCVLQCALAEVFDAETLTALDMEHCPACGDFRKKTLAAFPREGYGFRKDAWPTGAHLLKPLERATIILVSDAFADAFRKHQFQGARIRRIGTWH